MTTMKFSAPAALPPGRYPATLVDITEGEGGKFGPYIDWSFEVEDPDGRGKTISRRTSTKTGSGSIARVLVESMLGRSVELDEEVDLDALIGKVYELEVEPNQNGYDSVTNAHPIIPGGTMTREDVDEVAF